MARYVLTMGGTEQGKNRHNTSYNIHRDYTAEAQRLFDSFPQDFIRVMKDNDYIRDSFYYRIAKNVLDEPSMGWAFKAILINDTLNKMMENDLLVWCDSNHVLVGDIAPIEALAYQHNIFCHDHSPTYYPNSQWTKRDTFINMECDESRYWNAPQIQVNVMAFVKNETTECFVSEWLKYCLRYDVIIGNDENTNFANFIEHRHEQALFSILREKHNIPYFSPMPQVVGEMMGINKES